MNKNDNNLLINEWNRQTNTAEGVIQDCVKRAQDHAYQVGLERGFESQRVYYAVLEALQDVVEGAEIKNNEDMPAIMGRARKALDKAERNDCA